MKLRGFAKYLALQVPEAVVVAVAVFWTREWLGLPTWGAFGVVALWLLKDLAMYPFVRRSFEEQAHDRVGVGRLIGQHGVAEDDLSPEGYVRVRDELWRAESAVPVSKGSRVRVRAVRGLTLQVEPIHATDA